MLRGGTETKAPGPLAHEIYEHGLVLILRELHDRLDRAVLAAYRWSADLSDYQIVAQLLALNMARASEEARGVVRWLRPEYQVPKFASVAERASLELAGVADGQKVEKGAAPKS